MFALAAFFSWSKASATMFTSYMAISNMSVVIGGKLIEPLTQHEYWPNIYFNDVYMLISGCFS